MSLKVEIASLDCRCSRVPLVGLARLRWALGYYPFDPIRPSSTTVLSKRVLGDTDTGPRRNRESEETEATLSFAKGWKSLLWGARERTTETPHLGW